MRSVASLRRALTAAMLLILLVVPSAASASSSHDRAVISAMNVIRREHHLPGLHVNDALHRAASAQSAAMLRSGTLSHGSVGRRLRRYTRSHVVGETLAWMSSCDETAVVSMWLQSPAHRHVMLSPRFRRVGVGARGARGSCMVTADFASAH